MLDLQRLPLFRREWSPSPEHSGDQQRAGHVLQPFHPAACILYVEAQGDRAVVREQERLVGGQERNDDLHCFPGAGRSVRNDRNGTQPNGGLCKKRVGNLLTGDGETRSQSEGWA